MECQYLEIFLCPECINLDEEKGELMAWIEYVIKGMITYSQNSFKKNE